MADDDDAFNFIIDRSKKEPDLHLRYYNPPIQTYEYMIQKREFLEGAKIARYNEKPIQRYYYIIRGMTPWYDYSFEKTILFHILKQDLELMECYCNSSRIKKGEYCLTCTLLRSMHEYMMRLFRRASEQDSDLK
jgi:hypothetical protein